MFSYRYSDIDFSFYVAPKALIKIIDYHAAGYNAINLNAEMHFFLSNNIPQLIIVRHQYEWFQ